MPIWLALWLIISSSGPLLALSIERSIVPTVEHFEHPEHLNPKKYAAAQLIEIQDALKLRVQKIRVVSYNVLFHINDAKLEPEFRWPERLPRIVALLDELQADIIAVQEPYAAQVNDLIEQLKRTYVFHPKHCGQRECNGFFINHERFEVLGEQVRSLTRNLRPEQSVKFTLLQLKDRQTGQCFLVANTHLSFSNIEQRATQAQKIVSELTPYLSDTPVFFAGDMNTIPQRLDSKSLPFYDGTYIERMFTRAGLVDARDVSVLGHFGPLSTFSNNGKTGTPFKGTGTPGIYLDHIYVTPNITVLAHAVQSALVDNRYASDHFPIFVDAVLPNMPDACACHLRSPTERVPHARGVLH